MNTVYPVLGTPHVGFIALILIGGLAGWIASIVTKSGHGLFTNILVGIAGSWIGSQLAEVLQIAVNGTIMHLAMAVVGSIAIIYLWRMIHPDNGLRVN